MLPAQRPSNQLLPSPFKMRLDVPPVYLVTEQIVNLLDIICPKSIDPATVPCNASTGFDAPNPDSLMADRPDVESDAVWLLPVPSDHVRACKLNSPWRYHAKVGLARINGRSGDGGGVGGDGICGGDSGGNGGGSGGGGNDGVSLMSQVFMSESLLVSHDPL